MYIGFLNTDEKIRFTYSGLDIPFESESRGDGEFLFKCADIIDREVDAHIHLAESGYIGALGFNVSEGALLGAEIYVDGVLAARRMADGFDGRFGGEINIPVGVNGQSILLRLSLYSHNDIELSKIYTLGARDDGEPLIYPTPKSKKFFGETKPVGSVFAATDDPDELFAAEFLREGISERFGECQASDGVEVIFEKDPSYEDERYTVKYSDGAVRIRGSKRITMLYGATTLMQITSEEGIALADIDDAPSMKLRGFHFGLPRKDKIEFTKKLFRYVLLPMKYNVIFMEFAGGMRFDSHPEISEAWLRAIELADKGLQPYMPHSDKVSGCSLVEKAEAKEVVDYAKELGFLFVPEIQSLSHVQFITYAHPDIAERVESTPKAAPGSDDNGDDAATFADFYDICYCPSNEKSYEIIFDLFEEILELTQPSEYVLIGHDEADHVGLCPRCKGKDPGDLFAYHATRIYEYLKARGLKTMMWADNLQPPPVTRYPTAGAREKLPRDIILLDFIWYFRLNMDTEDYLLSHGYKVAVGNLYSSHFPRFKSRITKENMVGGEVSMWLMADEDVFGECGKLWDIEYLSEMLWNTEGYEAQNRRAYSEIIAKKVQPTLRDGVRSTFSPKGYECTHLKIGGDRASVPPELIALAPDTVMAKGIKVDIDGKFDRLVFEHSTLYSAPRIAWKPNFKIGEYLIRYGDGTAISAEVIYCKNAMRYKSVYGEPKPDNYYRHMGYVGTWFADPVRVGKSSVGEDITVLGFVFENPHPEKEIVNIEFSPREDDYTCLTVSGIMGLKKKI